MRAPLKIVLGFFILFIGKNAVAQDTIENFIEQNLEGLAESSQNEEADYTNLLETFNYYRAHPIDLNRATSQELSELGILNELQIESLLSHIDKNGKLISVYELQCVDGFDLQTIEKIRPFIKVADVTEQIHLSFNEIIQQGNHLVILRGQQVLEKQAGYSTLDSAGIRNNPNSKYIGSPQKTYVRYRFNYGKNVSVGFTAEKDPGELFFKKNIPYQYPYYDSLLNGKQKNGFDFYSAHFFIKNIGFIKALAIGDYQVEFGQGLTAWSGLAYGKTSDAMNIKRSASGVRPYTSVDENRFLRGAAITSGIKDVEFTGFVSRKKTDANVTVTDSLNENVIGISSLQTSGLHTTPSEIADKHTVTETVVGGNVTYRKRRLLLGLTGTSTSLSAALNQGNDTYNLFEFKGKQLSNAGVNYSYLFHNINLFGETGTCSAGGLAFLNGCIASLDPKLSASILHRSYQKNYQSLFSNSFAENSSAANEHGIYLGINIKPAKTIAINAYYDHFVFAWLKYRVNAPSNGSEYIVQVNYLPNKRFETYIRINQKDKFINAATTDEIDFISPFKQTNYRWHVNYQISPTLKLRNRVEFIVLDNSIKEKENGYLVFQDVSWRPNPGTAGKMLSKFSLTFRYALFDTKSYDSRLYAYESDLPGSYSIPSYYNKGSRTYIMVNYDITRSIELWLRWSQTYYSDKSVINQGALNEIKGNTKTEVKAQMNLRF